MATQSWVNRVQEANENTPLYGPCVEDQRSGVVSYLHRLGVSRQEFQDPVAQGEVQTHGPELNVSWRVLSC